MRQSQFSVALLTVAASLSASANGIDQQQIVAELQAADAVEQAAFKAGDCDRVLASMTNDVTFTSNTRTAPNRDFVKAICLSAKRPFLAPEVDEMTFFPLTAQSAYSIRKMVLPAGDAETGRHEVVTKIWKKEGDKWRIQHMHVSIQPAN